MLLGDRMNIDKLNKLINSNIDCIEKGLIQSSGYVFLFIQLEEIERILELKYSSKFSNIGLSKDIYEKWKDNEIENFRYEKIDDLYYAGVLKTLLPSINFNTEDSLFNAGLLIRHPNGGILPAIFYIGKSGAALGGWKEEMLDKFIGIEISSNKIKKFKINISKDEIDELCKVFELALQSVPISDFEGEFWNEYGGINIGIKSGIPYIEDIPIEEDIDWALTYYQGELLNVATKDLTEENTARLSEKTKVNPELRRKLLGEFTQELMENSLNDLVEYCYEVNSRLVFQALGYFLMTHDLKIPNKVKKIILSNSRWVDERKNVKDKEKKRQRKKELLKFKVDILLYSI